MFREAQGHCNLVSFDVHLLYHTKLHEVLVTLGRVLDLEEPFHYFVFLHFLLLHDFHFIDEPFRATELLHDEEDIADVYIDASLEVRLEHHVAAH